MIPLPALTDTIECNCSECVAACKKKPGWFHPDEIKPAADFLGLTEEEFFKQYLSVDYYSHTAIVHLFVLSPATHLSTPGKEFPLEPNGRCVFLKDDLCSIHAVKPYECKRYDHRRLSMDIEQAQAEHLALAEAWIPHKEKITQLLGREPNVEMPDPFEMLSFLMNVNVGLRSSESVV